MYRIQNHGMDIPTDGKTISQQALQARAYHKWQHHYQVL